MGIRELVGCFAGRIGVNLTNTLTLSTLFVKLGFLGNVGLFGSDGSCCVRFTSVGKLTGSDPMFTGNCDIKAIRGVLCGCGGPNRVLMRVDISRTVHFSGSAGTRLITTMLNKYSLRVTPKRSTRCCMPNSAVGKYSARKLVSGTSSVLPRIRRVVDGMSSLLADLGTLTTGPGLSNVVTSTGGVARGLSRDDGRLGTLVRRSLPRLAKGVGRVKSGILALASGVGGLSLRKALNGISAALGCMRLVARGVGHGSGALKLLLGSDSLCGGLDGATNDTGGLLVSLGRRPGHCMRFSLFKGGSG